MSEIMIETFKFELQRYRDAYYDTIVRLVDGTIKSLKEIEKLKQEGYAYSKLIDAIENLIKLYVYP
jgi:non-homologous end joining protein Ku